MKIGELPAWNHLVMLTPCTTYPLTTLYLWLGQRSAHPTYHMYIK